MIHEWFLRIFEELFIYYFSLKLKIPRLVKTLTFQFEENLKSWKFWGCHVFNERDSFKKDMNNFWEFLEKNPAVACVLSPKLKIPGLMINFSILIWRKFNSKNEPANYSVYHISFYTSRDIFLPTFIEPKISWNDII